MTPVKLSFTPVNLFGLLVLWLVSASGCGDGRPVRVPVAGLVTIDSKPFTAGGNIVFKPPTGRPSAGEIDKEGKFRLGTFGIEDGCPVGDFTVTVTSIDRVGPDKRRWNLPKKYHQAATSDLKQTIAGPVEQLMINLSWDGQSGPLIEQTEVAETP